MPTPLPWVQVFMGQDMRYVDMTAEIWIISMCCEEGLSGGAKVK